MTKVGLAIVGPAHCWLKSVKELAKVGLAIVGPAHCWLKSVKELAKVGLAKVGLAKVGHTRGIAGGTRPPDLDDLGEDVWDPEGIKILDTPIGFDDFVQSVLVRRLVVEAKLWTALTWVPDLQCAWQGFIVQCAGPRCHHLLTLPPSQLLEYAVRHHEGMMQAMDNLLGGLTGGADEKEVAHQVASLPMRLGGLGLSSARRMVAGAYWSSWTDALMVHQRLPRMANSITDRLEGVAAARGCLTELREVADRLDRQGFVGRPGWGELKGGGGSGLGARGLGVMAWGLGPGLQA